MVTCKLSWHHLISITLTRLYMIMWKNCRRRQWRYWQPSSAEMTLRWRECPKGPKRWMPSNVPPFITFVTGSNFESNRESFVSKSCDSVVTTPCPRDTTSFRDTFLLSLIVLVLIYCNYREKTNFPIASIITEIFISQVPKCGILKWRNDTNDHKVQDWYRLAHCPLRHVIQLSWSLVPEQ
jgi:hypothetical protein